MFREAIENIQWAWASLKFATWHLLAYAKATVADSQEPQWRFAKWRTPDWSCRPHMAKGLSKWGKMRCSYGPGTFGAMKRPLGTEEWAWRRVRGHAMAHPSERSKLHSPQFPSENGNVCLHVLLGTCVENGLCRQCSVLFLAPKQTLCGVWGLSVL